MVAGAGIVTARCHCGVAHNLVAVGSSSPPRYLCPEDYALLLDRHPERKTETHLLLDRTIAEHPEWQKHDGESSREYGLRMAKVGRDLAAAPGGIRRMPR